MNEDPIASPDPVSKPEFKENPFAAPRVVAEPLVSVDGVQAAECVRFEYIKREASVKSIGTLYYLAGSLLGLYSIFTVYALMGLLKQFGDLGAVQSVFFFMLPVFIGGASVFLLVTAYGLRRLLAYSRVTGILCSLFGLFVLPLGTIVSAYSLYLLLGAKGKFVFEPEYKAVVAATPHVRYQTPLIVWIIFVLIVLLMVLWIAFGLSS
ncbi:MAG: hypothetical protein AAF664_25325 [Planctomycetota bacterium]